MFSCSHSKDSSSDWMDAQADLSSCIARRTGHLVGFVPMTSLF